tara:strand:+ start:7095 stop:7841 length:747 start_codon:yes stop_codon:yes gene_type:complete
MENLDLIKKAKILRKETFDAFIKKGEAHLGGSFSMIETLVFLIEKVLKKNDKFILSKSHASYPFILMLRKKGFKPKLTTHLEIDEKNGINCTTGSLGHGFPISVGMALARKKMKKKGNIYVMISDGECQEGTTWEASLIAAKHNLDNLFLIIDYNKIQALTTLKEGLPLFSLKKKFNAFNFNTIEIKDGHNFNSLSKNFKISKKKNKPTVFIVHTIKGKGIKKFENDPVWHARKIEGKDIEIGNKSLK